MTNHIVTTLIFIIVSISCTVSGNLLLKSGAHDKGYFSVWPFSLINTYTILGASAFAFGLLFYIMVLKRIPLNLAQSIFSVQFLLIILSANFILHEPIGIYRWIGIAFIGLGLLIIGLSSTTEFG